MENSERESMVKVKVKVNEDQCSIAEKKVIYRGWKAMPFVIGEI